jgi:hypothetical protein
MRGLPTLCWNALNQRESTTGILQQQTCKLRRCRHIILFDHLSSVPELETSRPLPATDISDSKSVKDLQEMWINAYFVSKLRNQSVTISEVIDYRITIKSFFKSSEWKKRKSSVTIEGTSHMHAVGVKSQDKMDRRMLPSALVISVAQDFVLGSSKSSPS